MNLFIASFQIILLRHISLIQSDSAWKKLTEHRHRESLIRARADSITGVGGRRDSFIDEFANPVPELRLPEPRAAKNTMRQASMLMRKGAPQDPLSEIELHSIKTAFNLIEGVWRDVSMGAEYISSSIMASIHEHLGEIGSELFSKVFMNNSVSKQVPTLYHVDFCFRNDSRFELNKFEIYRYRVGNSGPSG